MLNPFPDLLTYSFFAPFLLRVILGLITIELGFASLKSEKKEWLNILKIVKAPFPKKIISVIAILQIVTGGMLFFGFYTQIAALILLAFTFTEAFIEYKESSLLRRDIAFYLLMFIMSLSLLLTGAGAFAFDLPL